MSAFVTRILRLICALAFLAGAAHAAEPQATMIPRKAWLSVMESALPAEFCKAEMYFRQCFTVTEGECLEAATRSTLTCIAQLETSIPDPLEAIEGGKHWGTKIGECAGAAYEVRLKKKLSTKKECKDPLHWMQQAAQKQR